MDTFLVRFQFGFPATELLDYARRGFWALNHEVVPYERWTDTCFQRVSPRVGVAGYIEDVYHGLSLLGLQVPKVPDYPEELQEYLGRKIWRSTLGQIREAKEAVFIKPVDIKNFKGCVYSKSSRRSVVTIPDDEVVWCSELVNFASEYRVFVLDGELLDCRIYRGDWSKNPDHDIVDEAVRKMAYKQRAFCLDFGVTTEGKTLLVEMNDAIAFGHYGLYPTFYAKMLIARWEELTSVV